MNRKRSIPSCVYEVARKKARLELQQLSEQFTTVTYCQSSSEINRFNFQENGNVKETNHLLPSDLYFQEETSPSPPSSVEYEEESTPPLPSDVNLNFNNEEIGTESEEELISSLDETEIESRLNDIMNDPKMEMRKKLREWSVLLRVDQVKTTFLLKILKTHPCFKDLPGDSRTLKKTPRTTNVREMKPGLYGHIGLRKGIKRSLKKLGKEAINLKTLQISINVDGLPLFDKSRKELIPILGSINDFKDVFIIGAYYGTDKPDCNEFIRDFVTEAIDLTLNGIKIGKKTFKVRIASIICDVPAKAYLLAIKGHAGYNSCTKCLIQGKEKTLCLTCSIPGNRKRNCKKCKARKKIRWKGVCFPGVGYEKRTHKNFEKYVDNKYHHKETMLTQIPDLDMVQDICLDYMHLLCLGVMKRLLKIWFEVPEFKQFSGNHKKIISDYLKQKVASDTPIEYARKIESLDSFDHLKATEYRQLLLVSGPVLFKPFLNKKYFNHFLKLHYASRVFCCPDLCKNVANINYAEQLMEDFVTDFAQLYGENSVTHNIHCLVHLGDEVRRKGSLDKFSAFKFENFMKIIKGFVKKPNQPLQQILKRYEELDGVLPSSASKSSEDNYLHRGGPLPENSKYSHKYKQYKRMTFSKFCINIEKKADSYIICKKKKAVFRVYNILKNDREVVFVGKKFQKTKDFYKHPAPSSTLGIYVASEENPQFDFFPYNKEMKKVFAISCGKKSEDVIIAFPMLHIESQELCSSAN